MAKLIRVDKNGTKYFEGYVPCPRCDGKGVYIIGVCNGQPVLSPVDSGVCFKCGGTGKEWGKWKEYTPEYEAKLEERRRKRAEKREAELEEARKAREAELETERKAEEERLKAEAERIAAEKAKSNFVGAIGDKIDIIADYIASYSYERPSYAGYGTETVNIYIFEDMDGNKLVWKTSALLGFWNDKDEWVTLKSICRVTLKGTIKDHSIYKDEKQTILTRCKVKKRF